MLSQIIELVRAKNKELKRERKGTRRATYSANTYRPDVSASTAV
jgi:hypothetical protein